MSFFEREGEVEIENEVNKKCKRSFVWFGLDFLRLKWHVKCKTERKKSYKL